MKKLTLIVFLGLLASGTAFAQDATGLEADSAEQGAVSTAGENRQPEAATEPAPGNQVRAVFTTGVENREPVEVITEYAPASGGRLYFFSELINMQGRNVQHVWFKNREQAYSMTFEVSGARWRVNSSMRAEHFKPGDIVTVEIIDEDTQLHLGETTLNIK